MCNAQFTIEQNWGNVTVGESAFEYLDRFGSDHMLQLVICLGVVVLGYVLCFAPFRRPSEVLAGTTSVTRLRALLQLGVASACYLAFIVVASL